MKTPTTPKPATAQAVASSAWFCRIKEWTTIIVCACGIALLVAGCVRVDYHVFRAKYPNAGPGDYLWHRLVE